MQSVSSNAVALQVNALNSALGNLVKYKDLSIQAEATTSIVSGGGLLYKNYISIVSEIGAGHTVIGLYLRDWSSVYNYPFGIYQGDSGMIGLWTTNQAFRGRIDFRLVYI